MSDEIERKANKRWGDISAKNISTDGGQLTALSKGGFAPARLHELFWNTTDPELNLGSFIYK